MSDNKTFRFFRKNEGTSKAIGWSVILSYFTVFIFNTSFAWMLFMSIAQQAMAAESEAVYEQIQSQYKTTTTTDEGANEDTLSQITTKYSDSASGDSSITTKISGYNSDTNSSSLDLTPYQSNQSFDSRYDSAYSEGVGGLGVPKQPAVTGSSVTTNYSATGATATKDSSGNYSFTAPTDSTDHTVNNSQAFSNKSAHPDTEFLAGNDYTGSDNDAGLTQHSKTRISQLSTAKSSDGVVYRTLNKTYTDNKPTTIGLNDPMFANAKSSVNDAANLRGDFTATCENTTITKTKTIHHADMQDHYCQRPKKDNYNSCQLTRTLGVPVYISGGAENGSLSVCGDNCVTLTVGRLANNYLSGGSCTTFNHSIYMHFDKGAKIKSAILSSARWDDHIKITLGDEEIFKHVRRNTVTGQNVSWPVDGVNCEESEEWTLGAASSNHHVGGAIDVTSKIQAAVSANDGVTSIPFKQSVAVGDGGEAYSQITIYFENMKFENKITQTPDGCYDALKASNGVCQMSKWTPIEQGTRMYPADVLAYGKDIPLYPNDTGYLTWKANADGYFCDPLAKTKLCVDDAKTICYDYSDIKNMSDGCAKYSSRSSCTEVESTCVDGWKDTGTGVCYMSSVKYSCDDGTDQTITTTTHNNACDATLPCVGSDCSAGVTEKNTGFAETAAQLQATTFMGADVNCSNPNDPSSCMIFGGEKTSCGWAVGVISSLADTNCCELQAGMPSISGGQAAIQVVTSKYMLTIVNGVSQLAYDKTVTEMALETASSAYESIATSVTNAWGSVTGTATQAATTEAATVGIVEQTKQAVMHWANDALGDFGPKVFQQAANAPAGTLGLTNAAATVVQVFNVVMIAYAVYKISVMIAQMLVACEQSEISAAQSVYQKACYKVGGKYCSKEISLGFTDVCVKESQDYCCFDTMIARIIIQQSRAQFPRAEKDCSGLTLSQIRIMDWSQIDLSEWVVEMQNNNIIPVSSDDVTLDKLTGSGSILAGGTTTPSARLDTYERTVEKSGSSNFTTIESDANSEVTLESVDCSYLPRPRICDLK